MAEPPDTTPDNKARYQSLEFPPKPRSTARRVADRVAGCIAAWVLACPIAGFIAIVYKHLTNQGGPAISWSVVLTFLISWLALGIGFSIVFFIRASLRR